MFLLNIISGAFSLSVFDDNFQPHDLGPKEFKEFTLHMMEGLYYEPSFHTEPDGLCEAPRAPGKPSRPISKASVGRMLAPKLNQLGAILTPTLLNRMIAMFKIHGPVIPEAE